jgi:biuret amidohydrolase
MTYVAATIPYPYPFDGELTPEGTALVICGAQRGLIDVSCGATRVLSEIAVLSDAMERLGCPVFSLRLTGQRGPLSSPGEPIAVTGTMIHAAGWDGCHGSDLEHRLRTARIAYVVLVGFASELTVDSTIRTLNDRGFECLVLTDLCAPIDADLGAHALASVTMSGGIFGALGTSAALLDALNSQLEIR